jgi:hypothetical protein
MNTVLLAFLIVGIVGLMPVVPSRFDPTAIAFAADKTIVLDVSTDATTWRSTRGDISHLAENKRGDTFIVEGSIYPGGTIPSGDNVFGPDALGRIGTWVCRGTFNFDFDPDILAGAVPHVVTTQIYLLPAQFEITNRYNTTNSVASDGLEAGVTTQRIVLGGTGPCSGARGEVTQEPLGFSSGGLFNSRFTFKFSSLPSECKKLLK